MTLLPYRWLRARLLDSRVGFAPYNTCGHCGTILLHAEEDQVHGVLIRCTACGSYNSTDR